MSGESYVFQFTLVNKQDPENTVDITFPTTAEAINSALKEIGLPENASRDLYFLIRFETPYEDFQTIDNICETTYVSGNKVYENSINELNYLAELLDGMTPDEKLVFSAAIEAGEHCMYISDLINLAQNTECYNVIDNIYDYEDVTRYFLAERGVDISGLGFLIDYINFEKCGEDLCKEDGGVLLDGCYLETNRARFAEVYNGDIFTVPEQYRVVPFAREPDFLDRKVERSMELALDLDSFFRSHDKEYGEKYSAVDVPEHLSDCLLENNLDKIKDMLADLGQLENDVLPSELAEYEKIFLADIPEKQERDFEKPGRHLIHVQSACNSNYKGMIAFVGDDGKVYLGKQENYLFRTEHIPFYDNTDKSFTFVSDNKQMYYFLYGEGYLSSQADMVKNGYLTENDYAEFDRLQKGVLSQFEKTREFTFAGKPFEYLETAEKSEEQNYNHIDGIINNKPPDDRENKQESRTHGQDKYLHVGQNSGIISLGNSRSNTIIHTHSQQVKSSSVDIKGAYREKAGKKPSVKARLRQAQKERGERREPKKPPKHSPPER